MKKIILITIIIFSFSVFSFAQAEKPICPEIKVTAPSGVVMSGEPMNFSISVGEESEKHNYKYQWSVDQGEIIVGQETSTIKVATDGLEDTTITATVKIKGLPKICKQDVSESGVVAGEPTICLFNEYGKLPLMNEIAWIDNQFITLKNNPGIVIYFLFEIGKDEKTEDVEKRFLGLSEHFKRRKYNSNIVFYDVCRRDQNQTTFWFISSGEKIPFAEKCERINVRLN